MTNLDLACNRSRKDANGEYPTDFFSVVCWGKTAEIICERFAKGDQIIVYGRMESRKYDAKDGSKRTAWEVQVEGFEFCGPRSNAAESSSDPAPAAASEPADAASTDVPF